MDEIRIEKAALNPPLLDAALRAALPELIAGVSAGRGAVRVHFARSPNAAEAEQARQIIRTHDAAERSPDQMQAQANALRRTALLRELRDVNLSRALDAEALEKAVRWLLLRELRRVGEDV